MQKFSNISRIVGAFTAQAGNILQIAECIEYFLEQLGIVFYSHRVSYPNCLSAQVLPRPLKELAISRLQEVASRLESFESIKKNPLLLTVTRQQIQDNINYLQATDQNTLWTDFIEFNRRLDVSRKQGPLETIVPEFKPYV